SYLPAQNNQQGIRVAKLKIENENISKDIFLKWGKWEQISIDGIVASFKFGKQTWVLPFSLRLNEFQLDRYPGSMSPSSFASEITLVDEVNNVAKPYRIFMNNILEYKGYRFYQSSYDNDEKGTVLSVNHDYWGTIVTYIGYFLLFASLIFSFFTKKTRFSRISLQIKETHEQRKKLLVSVLLILFIFLGGQAVFSQDGKTISKEHAAAFGELLLQKNEGRIIPVNTMANQVLMKIYKKSGYKGLTADQVFLGMIMNPHAWQEKPMIKVGDPDLQSMLGIKGKYASINDFFNEKGQYVLKAHIDKTYAKKPAQRNMFDKELIYVDERVNVSYMAYSGS
ncbi:MAG: cytochrome c biogenesis protein ResB, partial [Cyclobacteriaceae bacterium]|nr:cytochrome c biogenesis protein ResB [Cyclobacteriaceae bacterium]